MQAVLSPRQLAEVIGVSESSVKRWVDDGRIRASRTAGGHRRISTAEAVRFIRETRAPLLRPDLLGLAELSVRRDRGERPADEADELYDLLRAGAAPEARGCLLSLYLEGRSVAQIVDGPLRSAMERLGEIWLRDEEGILWEHRATQIAIHALCQLRGLFEPAPTDPLAVGGAPPGDPYILPSLAVAAVLESAGLRAVNLGPDTPVSTLSRAAASSGAGLVWVSVSLSPEPRALADRLQALVGECEDRGTTLVVGGRAASELGLAPNPRLYVGGSMAELEALVRGLHLADAGGPSDTIDRDHPTGARDRPPPGA